MCFARAFPMPADIGPMAEALIRELSLDGFSRSSSAATPPGAHS